MEVDRCFYERYGPIMPCEQPECEDDAIYLICYRVNDRTIAEHGLKIASTWQMATCKKHTKIWMKLDGFNSLDEAEKWFEENC